MSFVEKALDFYKTNTGRIVAVLVALAVVLAFSNLAYGGDAQDEPDAQSEDIQILADEGSDSSEGSEQSDEMETELSSEDEGKTDDGTDEAGTEVVSPDMAEIFAADTNPVNVNVTAVSGTDNVGIEVQGFSDTDTGWVKDNAQPGEELTVVVYPNKDSLAYKLVSATASMEYTYEIPVADDAEGDLSEPIDQADVQTATFTNSADLAVKELAPETSGSNDEDEAPIGLEITVPADIMHGSVSITVEAELNEQITSWDQLVSVVSSEKVSKGTLAADIDVDNSKTAVVENGKDFQLDLNGYTIHRADGEYVASLFTVNGGAKLTIVDSNTPATVDQTWKSASLDLRDVSNPADDLGSTYDATNNNQDHTFSYYMTTSVSNGSQGATTESRTKATVTIPAADGQDGIGAITAGNQTGALVKLNSGAALDIQGGRFTNLGSNQSNGVGVAVDSNGGNITMENGYIVGCQASGGMAQDLNKIAEGCGAALKLVGGSASINGGVIGGNISHTAGGAIYAQGATVSISGNTLIASNKVQTRPSDDDWGSSKQINTPEGNKGTGFGGAIFATAGSSVSISGESAEKSVVVASNGAPYMGGGIHIQDTASTLNVGGNAYVTNNYTVFKTKDSIKGTSGFTVGGGGIYSSGHLSLGVLEEGLANPAYVTQNYSSDGGGGILSLGLTSSVTINNAFISSNYAKNSEGGGLYVSGNSNANNIIKSGYITNNVTATTFDFGGGGLYVANNGIGKRSSLEILYPIVTNNNAGIYGGGVATCQNGIAFSNKGAVFNNSAEGKPSGDDRSAGDFSVKAFSDFTYNYSDNYNNFVSSHNDGKGAAQDVFGGGVSEFTDKMLGNDDANCNWVGVSTMQPGVVAPQYEVSFSQSASNGWGALKIRLTSMSSGKSTEFTMNEARIDVGTLWAQNDPNNNFGCDYMFTFETSKEIAKVAKALNDIGVEVNAANTAEVQEAFADVLDNSYLVSASKTNTRNRNFTAPKGRLGVISIPNPDWAGKPDEKDFDHIYIFDDSSYPTNIWMKSDLSRTGSAYTGLGATYPIALASMAEGAKQATMENIDMNWPKRDLLYDGNGVPTFENTEALGIMHAALHLKDVALYNTPEVDWPMYGFWNFPDNGTIMSNKVLAMTAHPSVQSMKDAYEKGSLFITGNEATYSNGGGIASNGDTVIGEVPDMPQISVNRVNEMMITKTLNNWDDNAGEATVVFRVAHYLTSQIEGIEPEDEQLYTMVLDSHSKDASIKVPVKAGHTYLVEELSIDGSNYTMPEEGRIQVITIPTSVTEEEAQAGITVEFVNTFIDEDVFGGSIKNIYKKAEDGANWIVEQIYSKVPGSNNADQGEDQGGDSGQDQGNGQDQDNNGNTNTEGGNTGGGSGDISYL